LSTFTPFPVCRDAGEQYKAVADQSRKVFAEYDPDFEAMSLDEAYLVSFELGKVVIARMSLHSFWNPHAGHH
jgi:nucleotidyltransferase/DNA polymerase involved in DNA repair